jgi:hypothetical protein
MQTLLDAAENVVIAFGMGWDMEGVIENLKTVIEREKKSEKEAAEIRGIWQQAGQATGVAEAMQNVFILKDLMKKD